jgi:hypothetical protein
MRAWLIVVAASLLGIPVQSVDGICGFNISFAIYSWKYHLGGGFDSSSVKSAIYVLASDSSFVSVCIYVCESSSTTCVAVSLVVICILSV